MSNRTPTVYLVDDDPQVLKAVSRLLQAAGFHVRAFSSPRRFLDEHDPAAPGCLVLDLAMPGLSGLELQEALAAAGEMLPIIFLTGRADVPASVKAMKRGAVDLLTKPVERDELVATVRTAIARDLAGRLLRQQLTEIRSRLATLTPREYQVFEHVIRGDLNKQTAAELGAAEKTIKIHRARVMEKMQVKSVAELVRLAEHAGVGAIATQLSAS
jgi:FixJ family two-component response regulator